MKRALVISFDLIRDGETDQSLALASILTNIKADIKLQERITLEHHSVNMLHLRSKVTSSDFESFIKGKNLKKYDYILLSVYIWNEYFINDFISFLRHKEFRGLIVLGGYQITYLDRNELDKRYPGAQVFIVGYAEQALKDLFGADKLSEFPLVLKADVDFDSLVSPYLNNAITVGKDVTMLRWETKRGCPYRCSFCAHRDNTNNKVYYFRKEKVIRELAFFNNTHVKRINIVDPVYNIGPDYIPVMQEILSTKSKIQFTLQTRFESIKNEPGKQFLDMCASGNFHLEFGLQTMNIKESDNIDRKNNYIQIFEVLREIVSRNISFEISMIYGLPGQTLRSFEEGINQLYRLGCKSVKAYPLMLLPGTKMYKERGRWDLKEEVAGDFNIPLVTSSNSFSRKEWESMQNIANKLMQQNRI